MFKQKTGTIWRSAFIPLLLAVFFAVWSSSLAKASEPSLSRFLIIVSKNSEPYIECVEGVKNLVEKKLGKKVIINSIYLEEDQKSIERRILRLHPVAAVTVGTRAAFFLNKLLPPFPWVATFLIDKSIEELKNSSIRAVSMDVPLKRRVETLCQIRDHILAGFLRYKSPKTPVHKIDEGACRGKDVSLMASPYFFSIETALDRLIKEKVNAFFITPDPRIFNSQEAVAYTLLWGLRNKIAVCGLSSGYVRNGALFALEADIKALGEQAAQLALDCLSGDLEGKTIIQHPTKLLLSINLKTARRLGLSIPRSVLDKAQLVIR